MKRIITAFVNSLAGLKHGFKNEMAIRQELLIFIAALPAAPFLTDDPWRMLLLWASLLLVLLVELLNTGIEQLSDKLTLDFSPEIKIAKDCGSAAVLIASFIAVAVWGLTLWEWWSG